jgi:hypothetical protein
MVTDPVQPLEDAVHVTLVVPCVQLKLTCWPLTEQVPVPFRGFTEQPLTLCAAAGVVPAIDVANSAAKSITRKAQILCNFRPPVQKQ